jgi:hypothetical protein
MNDNRHDDDRSIRRIAVRILSEDEDDAREELNNVIYSVEDSVQLRTAIYNWSFPIFVIFPALFWVLAILTWALLRPLGNIFFLMSALCALLPLYAVLSWYRFQYGGGRIRGPRGAIYINASDETREKLDKLFAFMQRDSAPKAYYRTKKGALRYLDHNYTYGSLRILLLSASPSVRALYLPPSRRRIADTIKIDAEPDEVIKALNIKPTRKAGPGTKAKYPYVDAVLWLIDEPRLKELDLTNRNAAIEIITKWLSEWFNLHADASGNVPRNDLLKPSAEKIYERQKKITVSKAG